MNSVSDHPMTPEERQEAHDMADLILASDLAPLFVAILDVLYEKELSSQSKRRRAGATAGLPSSALPPPSSRTSTTPEDKDKGDKGSKDKGDRRA